MANEPDRGKYYYYSFDHRYHFCSADILYQNSTYLKLKRDEKT